MPAIPAPSALRVGVDIGGTFTVILHEQPGGGGHGDPLVRDPARVAEDVRDEKVSIAYARREHGVVIDPVTLKVDEAATRAARAAAATEGGAHHAR